MWLVISTLLLKVKDYSRSHAVMCTTKVETVQDRDVVTTGP